MHFVSDLEEEGIIQDRNLPSTDSSTAEKDIYYMSDNKILISFHLTKISRLYQNCLLGLKCIHEQPANGQPAKVVQCDILGGAHYCAKMVAPWGTAKTCGVGVILDAFKYFGLTSDGCTTNSGYTFCLCSTSECN